ncbi:hypothetical protein B0H17DRAFT_1133471 [Mycena rosella]|uniref:Uncharacterized protein n=1 Tax=Mycena rosella TaxID=1033263 RepID=A0AAD7GI42_MYCRO|nr:hypothetical protein B0H17DRAFT_1133471 [Mycena rosella]
MCNVYDETYQPSSPAPSSPLPSTLSLDRVQSQNNEEGERELSPKYEAEATADAMREPTLLEQQLKWPGIPSIVNSRDLYAPQAFLDSQTSDKTFVENLLTDDDLQTQMVHSQFEEDENVGNSQESQAPVDTGFELEVWCQRLNEWLLLSLKERDILQRRCDAFQAHYHKAEDARITTVRKLDSAVEELVGWRAGAATATALITLAIPYATAE